MSSRPFPPLCLALLCAAGPGFARALPPAGAPEPNTHSIMHFTPEWYVEHHRRRARMPVHHATLAEYCAQQLPLAPGTAGVNLIAHMDLSACGGAQGWNQGQCGNCWVFGSSAACSIEGGIATGSPQLFSPQWFDSDYYATSGSSVCGGGDSVTFADWYNSNPKFIPWSNTNAAYADGNGNSPNTPATSIAQTPFVGVQTVAATRIATDSVSQAEAIANIKSVLDANQPVTFAFFLPSDGWTAFDNAWDSDGETSPWSGWDSYSGASAAGGHLVCCVGYDNSNSTWIMRNSWGTTSGRPNGFFEVPQALGYGDTMTNGGQSMPQFEFDTFEVTGWTGAATAPAITSQPANQTVGVGQSAQFRVTASGAAPLSYQWYRGASALGGANAALYTTPAATAADNGATFHVVVSNSAGSATSNTATLTVTGATTAPAIAVNPLSQTVAVGGKATFTVTASGAAPLAYQWYRNGAALASATSASYTTPAVTSADNGATFSVKVSNAYGSATSSSATLTVGAAPVGGDLIVNGGFEQGTKGWTATSGLIGQYGTLEPTHGGTWEAWFGSPLQSSPGSAWQAVTLPSPLTRATLSFQLHIDAWRNRSSARFEAQVRNASGTVLAVLGKFTRADAASGYQAHTFDLTPYRGQTVRIAFQAFEGRWGGTDFVLDDVSLKVQ